MSLLDKTVEFINENGGLCFMNELTARVTGVPHISVAARFGLGLELFFDKGDDQSNLDHAKDFLLFYYQHFNSHVTQFLPSEGVRLRKISGDLGTLITQDMQKHLVPGEFFGHGFGIFGLPHTLTTNKYREVKPYRAETVIHGRLRKCLSTLSSTFPICTPDGKNRISLLKEMFLHHCQVHQPAYGCAGLTVILESSQDVREIYGIIKQYPGLDVQDVCYSALQGVRYKLKSINWLTALCDEMVAQLGGESALRKQLEPLCQLHAYPGGVVIQAGDTPELGDAANDDIPPAYRLAAKVTRPVRFDNYGNNGLFYLPIGLDRREEMLAWAGRFD